MKVNVINKVKGINFEVNEVNGVVNVQIYEAGKMKKLCDCKKKDIVKIAGVEFVVLEVSGDTVALITKESIGNFQFGNNNNWAESYIRKELNTGEFYKKISAAVGKENITEHKVDLTANDGLKDYGSCRDKISILTCDLYRRYRDCLPNCGRVCYLATADSTKSNEDSRLVCVVSWSGALLWHDCGYSYGVRPFLILDSSILVSTENE